MESNSRLDEDTNLTGYVCLVDSKKLPAAKLAFHPRSSYGAFEFFGNKLPLQPVHPSYCIPGIWLHHSSTTNFAGQPDIWLPLWCIG